MDPTPLKLRRAGKTDIPGTFNAGVTLGPVNETNMVRIWNKHKQTNAPLKRKVFVGMSGGVDSSVTAALLKERGFDVRGVHIKMWSDESIPCQFKEDRRDALRVAEKLGIPFETWDLTEEYRDEVVNYMIREYASGRTPNPDVMCNRKIKFGIFLARALERGADAVATGHYVRREPEFSIGTVGKYIPVGHSEQSEESQRSRLRQESEILHCVQDDKKNFSTVFENCKLKIAKDLNKDQSYFLWTLTQEQLTHCLFPIGEYTKPEVRALARSFGLSTAEKPDSQGICFIGEIDLNTYLKKYIAQTPGRVVTTKGHCIGEHDGFAFYTIGQRAGLKVGGGIPYYVAKKDFQSNTLVVALGPFDEQLFSRILTAYDAHWIAGIEPILPLTCSTRIRYRQPLQSAVVEQVGDGKVIVRFNEPQRAITPGQSIVFYQNNEMLGGACIF